MLALDLTHITEKFWQPQDHNLQEDWSSVNRMSCQLSYLLRFARELTDKHFPWPSHTESHTHSVHVCPHASLSLHHHSGTVAENQMQWCWLQRFKVPVSLSSVRQQVHPLAPPTSSSLVQEHVPTCQGSRWFLKCIKRFFFTFVESRSVLVRRNAAGVVWFFPWWLLFFRCFHFTFIARWLLQWTKPPCIMWQISRHYFQYGDGENSDCVLSRIQFCCHLVQRTHHFSVTPLRVCTVDARNRGHSSSQQNSTHKASWHVF